MEKIVRITGLALTAALVASVLAIASAAAPRPASAASIATGYHHSCGITPTGALRCWGANADGQVGDGNPGTTDWVPVQVVGMNKGVTAVAAGGYHTCAIKGKKGTLSCWGWNGHGRLGDGTTDQRSTPVRVKAMAKGVTAVVGGHSHTCAIKGKKSTLFCWGANDSGQLGDGTDDDRTTPTKVKKMAKGVASVATTANHTCAIKGKKGTLFCWGENWYGQLGDGTKDIDMRKTPVKVKKMQKNVLVAMAGQRHTCAIKAPKRALFCWGENGFGQLGHGTTDQRITPVKVKNMAKGVTSVAAGGFYTCAAKGKKDTLFCWGLNSNGQLGDGTWDERDAPVKVDKMDKGVRAVATGREHACAAKGKKATLFCWGRNTEGQVGNNSNDDTSTPVKITL